MPANIICIKFFCKIFLQNFTFSKILYVKVRHFQGIRNFIANFYNSQKLSDSRLQLHILCFIANFCYLRAKLEAKIARFAFIKRYLIKN